MPAASGIISTKMQIGDIIPKPMGSVWPVHEYATMTQTVAELNVVEDIAVGGGKEHACHMS